MSRGVRQSDFRWEGLCQYFARQFCQLHGNANFDRNQAMTKLGYTFDDVMQELRLKAWQMDCTVPDDNASRNGLIKKAIQNAAIQLTYKAQTRSRGTDFVFMTGVDADNIFNAAGSPSEEEA